MAMSRGLAGGLVLVIAGCGGSDGDVRPVDLPTVAESSCRAAVVSETRSGSVRILRSAGRTVSVSGPGGTWTCQTDAAGNVTSLRRG